VVRFLAAASLRQGIESKKMNLFARTVIKEQMVKSNESNMGT